MLSCLCLNYCDIFVLLFQGADTLLKEGAGIMYMKHFAFTLSFVLCLFFINLSSSYAAKCLNAGYWVDCKTITGDWNRGLNDSTVGPNQNSTPRYSVDRYRNIDYPGGDIGNYDGISYKSCEVSCARTRRCNSFYYVDGKCYLKRIGRNQRRVKKDFENGVFVFLSRR